MTANGKKESLWDAWMGETVNDGLGRLIAAVLVFLVVGGTVAWLLT